MHSFHRWIDEYYQAANRSCNAPASSENNHAIAEDRAKELEKRAEDLLDELEAGVDLSCLNVEEETASKLIAGMQAMADDGAPTSLPREIAMPSARADLQEILKTDSVCMVSPAKTFDKASVLESSGKVISLAGGQRPLGKLAKSHRRLLAAGYYMTMFIT